MHDHRGKFVVTYEGPCVVKKTFFFGGALILANMDGHDFNMPTNSNSVIRYFAWRSLVMHLIFMFKKKKQKTIYIYICNKVDRKPERTVYAKGEPKERMWKNLLEWKPERAI